MTENALKYSNITTRLSYQKNRELNACLNPQDRALPCRRHFRTQQAVLFRGVNHLMITYSHPHPQIVTHLRFTLAAKSQSEKVVGKTVASLCSLYFAEILSLKPIINTCIKPLEYCEFYEWVIFCCQTFLNLLSVKSIHFNFMVI